MTLDTILETFTAETKNKLEELEREFEENLDFAAVEQVVAEMLDRLGASLLEMVLTNLLTDRTFLAFLKLVGGRLGMHFKEYRTITVRLYNGQTISIPSPYFIKATSKRKGKKRRKRGPNGRGKHMGLAVLGFIGRCSGCFVSEVVKLALLCPSFAVARAVLAERRIAIDVKTIRRLCRDLGKLGLELRGAISLDGTENLDGYTLVIGIDGGRLRERRPKEGPKEAGQKRQGFHTDWREPKLFTIYLLDEQGKKVKDFAPLHDATMGDKDAVFVLLERYLQALDVSAVARIVFCGDGAKWIWPRVEALCLRYDFSPEQIYQVIDYTHAKQNLREIIDSLPNHRQQECYREWKDLLWKGDIQGLYRALCQALSGEKRRRAVKKWQDYFERNEKRMQYATFKARNIPCGSGCVESAIRRVINLRLKAAGSFWTPEMAEYFLFLRSQLISGRWRIFIQNTLRRMAELVRNIRSQAENASPQKTSEVT